MLEVSDEKVVVGGSKRIEAGVARLVLGGEPARVKAWIQAIWGLILALAFVPNAYATDTNFVIYGPVEAKWQGITYVQVGVIASNRYDATLVLLGEDPNDEKFTPEIKSKLSSSSTGHAFYSFSQQWENPSPDDGLIPTISGMEYSPGFWSTSMAIYGRTNCWACEYRTGDLSDARRDLVTILNGGHLGGGEGGTVDGDLTFTYTGNGTKKFGDSFVASVTTDAADTINGYVGCFISWGEIGGAWGLVWVWEVPDTYELVYDGGRLTGLKNTSDHSYNIVNRNVATSGSPENGTASIGRIGSGYDHNVSSGGIYNLSNILYISDVSGAGGGSGGGSGGGDDGDWPDPDPIPDPPQDPVIPSPREPVPPDPPDDPDLPDPDPIPDPPQGPTVDDPTPPTVDDDDNFTYDFQGLIDALNEHCIHIQTNLNANFSAIRTYFSSKLTGEFSANRSYMQTVGDAINEQIGNIGDYMVEAINLHVDYAIDSVEQCFDDLISYLDEVTEWLDEKLNYKFPDSYDDTSVLYWLKRIWGKLGGGSVSTKPIDPVVDNQGTLEWLLNLLQQLLGDVAEKVVGALGMAEMLSAMGELTSYFPISIPWDMYAVVDLLDAEPVTPVFDLAMPTGFDGETVTVHVDLSPWDDVAAICRQGSVILFAVGLMWRVRSMIDTAIKVTG